MKIRTILLAALTVAVAHTYADTTVGVEESSATWLGYMNWSNLPAPDGDGAYQFGSAWGTDDLNSSFDDVANTLTLSPNTIGDPDPYWYIGGGGPGAPGNKIGEANLYIENDALNDGGILTFEGLILANTFTAAHSTRVFVSEFAPDYSSRVDSFFDVVAPGAFSVDLATSGTPGAHIQYGFQTVGVNVWVTDTAPFGSVIVETIPEPSSLALLAVAAGGVWGIRRMRG